MFAKNTYKNQERMIDVKIKEEDFLAAVSIADIIIAEQKKYIKELEQKNEDLQKALDAVLLNKCRTRKVKVKVYGRSPVDKSHPRTF